MSTQLWNKGFSPNEAMIAFTVGQDYILDNRLVGADIRASIAHVKMLDSCGHLPPGLAQRLEAGLTEVGQDHAAGKWGVTVQEEDCHTAIENRLTEKLGSEAGWVHFGRSRNDQVLVALRLTLLDELEEIAGLAQQVANGLESIAESQGTVPLPGYTHLQRAMPSSVGDWALGFDTTLKESVASIQSAKLFANQNPLGSAAGYGTPGLALNRHLTSELLGMQTQSPVTATQLTRGKAEAAAAFSCTLIQQDLGRLSADLCLFSTAEFGFVTLPKEYTTGSSIMPQKRNPDVFELIRGASATASSELQAILSLTAKMTSGYHRDLQLIKPPLFRIFDSTKAMLTILAPALDQIRFNESRTSQAMDEGLYAAEEAFRLVKTENIPFREAYRRIGTQYTEG